MAQQLPPLNSNAGWFIKGTAGKAPSSFKFCPWVALVVEQVPGKVLKQGLKQVPEQVPEQVPQQVP